MSRFSNLLDSQYREKVLLDPIRQGAEHLKIISGYATPTMASWHLGETKGINPINITLIVGMCVYDGISESAHEGFKNIVSGNKNSDQSQFICQYVVDGVPVHSKLYLWERSGIPLIAFMGSANYTQPAFFSSGRELLQECNPISALKYFDKVERNTMYCNHADVEDKIFIKPSHPIFEAEESPLVSVLGAGVDQLVLSLLTRTGDVGRGSGINWGHRADGTRRNPNEMYISLTANAKASHPKFFPITADRSGKGNPNFSVLTDDGVNLILRVQQEGNKGITTPLDNSRIGEYFRGRLGLANGAFITKQDLENYGRTDVTFYKLDDEHYFMDFSC